MRNATQTEKSLFIPLKRQWFDAFADGSKKVEYRLYGPRWNERVCRVGRRATISCGYSGARLYGVVEGFERRVMSTDIYGRDRDMACIKIRLTRRPAGAQA